MGLISQCDPSVHTVVSGRMNGWLLEGIGSGSCNGVTLTDRITHDTANDRLVHTAGGYNGVSHYARLRLKTPEELNGLYVDLTDGIPFSVEVDMELQDSFFSQFKSYGRLFGFDNFPPTPNPNNIGAGDYPTIDTNGDGIPDTGDGEEDEYRVGLTFYSNDSSKRPRILVQHQGITESEVWTGTTTHRDQMIGRHVWKLRVDPANDGTGSVEIYRDGTLWASAYNINSYPSTLSGNRNGRNEKVVTRFWVGPDGWADQNCGEGQITIYSYRAAAYIEDGSPTEPDPPATPVPSGSSTIVSTLADTTVQSASTFTSAESGSITPVTNEVFLVAVSALNFADTGTPALIATPTGLGATWAALTQDTTLYYDTTGAGRVRGKVFIGTGATVGVSDTVVCEFIDEFGAQASASGTHMVVVRSSDVEPNSPVIRTQTTVGNASSVDHVLSPTMDAGSALVAFLFHTDGTGITAGGSMTELADSLITVDTGPPGSYKSGLEAQKIDRQIDRVQASWATPRDYAMFTAELRKRTSAPPPPGDGSNSGARRTARRVSGKTWRQWKARR